MVAVGTGAGGGAGVCARDGTGVWVHEQTGDGTEGYPSWIGERTERCLRFRDGKVRPVGWDDFPRVADEWEGFLDVFAMVVKNLMMTVPKLSYTSRYKSEERGCR